MDNRGECLAERGSEFAKAGNKYSIVIIKESAIR